MKNKTIFTIFLIAISLLRLMAATGMGQTVDEAHYVLYGRFVDLSYFDHPPLVGWIHFVFQQLPIDQLLKARLPAILISLFTTKLLHEYLLEKNISEKNSFLSLAVLNLTPLYNTMSIALLPDTLLMPLTILIIRRTEKILVDSNLKNWVYLGALLGLAGLAKYTAIVYVISLAIVFLLKNKIKELLNFRLWLGASLAIVFVSPVIIWNIKHDFASFKYQVSHVLSFDAGALKSFTASFLIQMFSWGLGPFFVALTVHIIFLRHIKSLQTKIVSVIFLTVFLAFFIYMSLSDVLLPHWMLIYFVLMIPVAFSQWLEKKIFIKTMLIAALISALLSLALLVETAFHVFPIKLTSPLYEGVTGWREIVQTANEKLTSVKNPKKALAVMNWTLGSRAMYYNEYKTKVFVLDKRFDQFDIWNPENAQGYDFILMIESNKKVEHLKELKCAQLNSVGEKITQIKEVHVNHFLYYHCADFKGLND